MWHLYVYNPEEKNLWRSEHPDLHLFHVQKISVNPLGPTKNCLQIGIYCIQNDRLAIFYKPIIDKMDTPILNIEVLH